MSDSAAANPIDVGVADAVLRKSPSGAPDRAVLPVLGAAIHLGITPELLFAYARRAPKIGDARKLPYTGDPHAPGFTRSDLDSWDQYLRAPWPTGGKDRAPVPTYVEDYLKIESGGRCALCGNGHPIDNAHITSWTESRSNHHHNLIRLCKDCHTKVDDGIIAHDELRKRKLALVERLRLELRATDLRTDGAAQLPNPDPTFVGRVSELVWLEEHLRTCRMVTVEGPAGIGKTQLVLRALAGAVDIPAIWVDVESAPTRGRLDAALALALAHAQLAPIQVPVVEALRDLRVRVVLDGLEHLDGNEWDEILDFLGALAAQTREPRFVLTSQVELHGVPVDARLTLQPLTASDSQALLRKAAVEASVDANDFSWVIEFCEGHALALRLTAALLAYYRSGREVVARLRAQGAAILAQPTRQKQTTSTSLSACLSVALAALSDADRRLLSCVAHFPGSWVDWVEMIVSTGDIGATVAHVRRWHLLDVREGVDGVDRLHMLSPIRSAVQIYARAHDAEADAALRRDATFSLVVRAGVIDAKYIQSSDAPEGIVRFDADLSNYLAALAFAAEDEQEALDAGRDAQMAARGQALLASSLATYLFSRGLLSLEETVLRQGIDAARRIDSHQTAASLLSHLVAVRVRREDLPGTHKAADEIAAVVLRCADPSIDARAAIASGDVALLEKRYSDAAEAYRRAIARFRTVVPAADCANEPDTDNPLLKRDDSNIGMEAIAEAQLGRALRQLRDYGASFDAFQHALAIFEKIQSPINVATTLHEIGNVLADLRKPAEACSAYEQAATWFAELGVADYITNSLSEIGHLLCDMPRDAFDARHIDGDVLAAGLEDLSRIVQEMMPEPTGESLPGPIAKQHLRKFFGVVTLVSASAFAQQLEGWADALREDVLEPAMAGLLPQSQLRRDPTYIILPLNVGLAVAGTIGSAEANRTEALASDVVQHLAEMAYVLESAGLPWARAFDWIRLWVEREGDARCPDLADLRRDAKQGVQRRGNWKQGG